mmetsp:Transcript_27489/g.57736  ORF Transcript_27489/g.57736 Transcript_27489/m.57736 type:complete len:217 (-) Transcript_27489:66-716(-)
MFEMSTDSGPDDTATEADAAAAAEQLPLIITGFIFNFEAADLIALVTGFPPFLPSPFSRGSPKSKVKMTPALPSSPSNICLSVVVSQSPLATTFRRHTNVAEGTPSSRNNGPGKEVFKRLTRSNRVVVPRMGASPPSASVGGTARRDPSHAQRKMTRMGDLLDFLTKDLLVDRDMSRWIAVVGCGGGGVRWLVRLLPSIFAEGRQVLLNVIWDSEL